MEIYQNLSSVDILKNRNVLIKNVVGLDIGSTASLSAIDGIIDVQITTQPTNIYNISTTNSLSGMYDSLKFTLYQKSGSEQISALAGADDSDSIFATNIKAILVPRETFKQRISPNSLTASIVFPSVTGTTWYIKDEPIDSTEGDYLYQGKLKLVTNSTDSTTASLTSLGEVFYNYGVVVFRGSVVANASLSAALSTANLKFGTVPNNSDIVIKSFLFKREQQQTKTIYFCRAYNNNFNYSNNPSYRNDDGTIKSFITDVVGDSDAGSITYVSSVGLYDDDNNLLAVAKISPIQKKTPEDELVFKIVLSY